MGSPAAPDRRAGEHGADETHALREQLRSALVERGRAEERVRELESQLRQAHEEAAAERDRANRIANRRIVRAALAAARPIRPLFRLVRRARRRGGRHTSATRGNRSDEQRDEQAPAAVDASALIPALVGKPQSTILIPLRDGLEDLQRCMEALLRNTPSTASILVVDHSGTDPDMASYLDTVEQLGHVQVLRNEVTLGFAGAVNRGLDEIDGDVVVVSSDTVVTPRWLQNLTIAAYRSEDIGTATSLTEQAGPFTVPIAGAADNPKAAALDSDDLGRMFTQNSLRRYPDTPSGNGACMYIKRTMLDDVGGFDEKSFPPTYAAEELCMRARDAGWRHVVDDATLVLHAEEESFDPTDRHAGVAAMQRVASERHPEYAKLVHEFMAGPDMTAVRSNAVNVFSTANRWRTTPRPRVLYVLHEGDGGTPETNRDLMFAVEDDVEPWLLTSTSRRLLLHRVSKGESELVEEFDVGRRLTTSDTTNPQYRQFVTSVLLKYAIEFVHVRQLIKHTLDLPEIAAAIDIPVVLSFHDFYFVCPTVHLLDNEGRWCGGQCTPGDGVCAAPRPDPSIHLKHSWVYVWQGHVREMFSHVDAFVATTPFTRDLYLRVYPELAGKQFAVIEHGRDLEQHHGINDVPVPDGPIRIAIVGNLARHKGSGFVRQIQAADHAGRIEFHLLGRTSDPDLGVVHGTYRREELPSRLADIAPHFIGLFSIWGETYSHTLTEAWACGVPVIASQLGALGERVSEHGGGWLVDPDDPVGAVSVIYSSADDTQAYKRQSSRATIDGLPSTAHMAERYLDLYSSTLDRVVDGARHTA